MTIRCPICQAETRERVLLQFNISAADMASPRSEIGGLAAFQCPQSHVFFVRESDLETNRYGNAAIAS